MRPPPGVTVRYSAPESADAAICRRLREIERPGEVIVVTNDCELSSRCRKAGANILDWSRFTLKMQARSAAPPRTVRQMPGRVHKKQRTDENASAAVDVDDWLRFFGMDEAD